MELPVFFHPAQPSLGAGPKPRQHVFVDSNPSPAKPGAKAVPLPLVLVVIQGKQEKTQRVQDRGLAFQVFKSQGRDKLQPRD